MVFSFHDCNAPLKQKRETKMKQHGVTLVELLTTLAVFSILLGIAVPGYGFLVNSSRLVGLTNDLVSTLNLARSEAVKRGIRVTVCKSGSANAISPVCEPDSAWQEGWLVFVDQGVIGEFEGSDRQLSVQSRKPDNIDVSTTNFSTYISYLPSGVSQGPTHLATGSFHICLTGNKRTLIINNTGRVRMSSGTC
jgi:type IV fimbrial biogenesis protein FimT